MRRYSEQLCAGTTIVKACLNNPETEITRDSTTTEQDDPVAYKRNMETSLKELQKRRPQIDLMEKFLKYVKRKIYLMKAYYTQLS